MVSRNPSFAAHVGKQPFAPVIAAPHLKSFNLSYGVHIILEDNLLRGMLETERCQPAPIGLRPAPFARIDTAVAEQKALKVLPRFAYDPHSSCSWSDEIPHGFVRFIRYPDRRKFARAV